jgi:hypothetical protein
MICVSRCAVVGDDGIVKVSGKCGEILEKKIV